MESFRLDSLFPAFAMPADLVNSATIVLVVCVAVFTLAAAVWDARTKRLPNWLTVPALAAALLFHAVAGFIEGGTAVAGWSTGGAFAGLGLGLLWSAAGFAVGFGILLVAWLIGSGGGGDVKLMGALGAWLADPMLVLYVFLIAVVIIIVASIGVLSFKTITMGFERTKARHVTRKKEMTEKERGKRRILPYGVPVAIATWCVLVVVVVRDLNAPH